MKEPQRRRGQPGKDELDVEDLLLHGWKRGSHVRSPSYVSRSPSERPSVYNTYFQDFDVIDKSNGRKRNNRRSWPPSPSVEDEVHALSNELDAAFQTPLTHEAAARGTIDQNPIIVDAELSPEDVARYYPESDPETRNIERRFVLLSTSSGDTPPARDINHAEQSTEQPKKAKTEDEVQQKKHELDREARTEARKARQQEKKPTLTGRRSRQELPTLQTEVKTERPSYRRSASAYSYTPRNDEFSQTPQTTPKDALLTPGVSQTFRGPTKGYQDAAVSREASPQQSAYRHHSFNSTRPRGLSRDLPSPFPQSCSYSNGRDLSADVPPRSPSAANGPKAQSIRPVEDQSASKPPFERQSTTQSQRLSAGYGTDGHTPRKSSRGSSRKDYSSTDDTSTDSSDSDSDRRRHRRRRRHRHRHHKRHDTLRAEDGNDNHRRPESRSDHHINDLKTQGKYASFPLLSPNVSPNQLGRGEYTRADTIPLSRNSRHSSRPVSPISDGSQNGSLLKPEKTSREKPASRRSSPISDGERQIQPGAIPIPLAKPSRIDLQSPGESRYSPKIPRFEGSPQPPPRSPSYRQPSSSPLVSPLPQYIPQPQPPPPPRSAQAQPYWAPPPFDPNNLHAPTPSSPGRYDAKAMGSFRRYSQDLSSGAVAPLPPCPRTIPLRNLDDWLTLPSRPSFNICPSCYASTIEPTSFRGHFVPAPRRPANEAIMCDFGSSPWYRIAWLLTRKDRRRDLALLEGIATVGARTEKACLGKHEAVREWYSVRDPDAPAAGGGGGPRHVRNFDVCLACVRSIETLLPELKGVFVRASLDLGASGLSPTNGNSNVRDLPRVCDMRFDSKRFVHYFDALERLNDEVAEAREDAAAAAALAAVRGRDSSDDSDGSSDGRRRRGGGGKRSSRAPPLPIIEPDTSELVAVAKRFAAIRECQGETELFEELWHFHPQLPELTVCEECYADVVVPQQQQQQQQQQFARQVGVGAGPAPMEVNPSANIKGANSPNSNSGNSGSNNLAMLVPRTRAPAWRASCQLYSARMRDVFRRAVERDDWAALAAAARERRAREIEWKARLRELGRERERERELSRIGAGGAGEGPATAELRRVEREWRKVE